MKWIVLPYSESYFEETIYILVNFYHFPVFNYTIKRKAFDNAYESFIIFSLIYMPTFLPNLRLIRPLSVDQRQALNDK